MSLRIGGIAAILAGILWATSLVLASGTILEVDGIVTGLLLVAGAVTLLVALAGLSAFQARAHPLLSWVAFAVPAAGAVVSLVGVAGMTFVGDRPMVGDLSPWYIWVFGTLTVFLGSGLFAIVTYRTAALSRIAAITLGVGSVAVTLAVLIGAAGGVPEAIGIVLTLAGVVSFLVGWCALGVDAIRLDQSSAAPRPA